MSNTPTQKTLMEFSCITLADFREVFDKIEAAGYDMEKVWMKSGDFSGSAELIEMTDSDGDVRYDLELC